VRFPSSSHRTEGRVWLTWGVRRLERAPEFAVVLCFDVPVDRDAEKLATEVGLRLFKGEILKARSSCWKNWGADCRYPWLADIIYQ
jgi:hypothetical protein